MIDILDIIFKLFLKLLVESGDLFFFLVLFRGLVFLLLFGVVGVEIEVGFVLLVVYVVIGALFVLVF
jgi:hypothetical protein